jgi:hypothetical protein
MAADRPAKARASLGAANPIMHHAPNRQGPHLCPEPGDILAVADTVVTAASTGSPPNPSPRLPRL